MNIVGNSLWEIVRQVDAITLAILVLLCIMSIMCWGVALYKVILMNIKQKELAQTAQLVLSANTIDDIERVASRSQGESLGVFLNYIAQASRKPFSEKDFELLQLCLDQELARILHHHDEYMAVLSTCAAASPLIGLFGTVWGLIHSFLRISQQQSADIATVAPGIAEALITTLAGLVVAIPALLLFHYIQSKIKNIEFSLYSLEDASLLMVRKASVREALP